MRSVFDSPAFNSRLFFPRPLASPPPPGARDARIAVTPGVSVHLRVHPAPAARALVLLFHGNGEIVADYDAAAADYAAVGARLAVMDYRGYGASDGVPTLRSSLADAHLVLSAARAASSSGPADRRLEEIHRAFGTHPAIAQHPDSSGRGLMDTANRSGFIVLEAP